MKGSVTHVRQFLIYEHNFQFDNEPSRWHPLGRPPHARIGIQLRIRLAREVAKVLCYLGDNAGQLVYGIALCPLLGELC